METVRPPGRYRVQRLWLTKTIPHIYVPTRVRMLGQVTTLLSKAEHAEAQAKVTPDALAALEARVSEQGGAVAGVKAVRAPLFGAGGLRSSNPEL